MQSRLQSQRSNQRHPLWLAIEVAEEADRLQWRNTVSYGGFRLK